MGVESGLAAGLPSLSSVMDPSQLQRYHRLLMEKQRELLSGQSDDLARVPAAGSREGDVVDQANADAEAELQIHMHKSDSRLLKAIEEALARMREGTYGVCTDCKEPITKARLEAVPWTHLCRECKERQAT
jgi:RNA polymerase-binding transcription factor